MPRPLPIILLGLTALLSGCAHLRTSKTHYAGTASMLAKGDYSSAISKIEAAKEKSYTHKDRVVYYLDTGMLYHWNGQYEKSNEQLEKAERAIEENFTKSISRSASSLILNDNARAYAGEDYEDIYLNAFKALNYLALGKNDSAFVEVRRINQKLTQLEDKYDNVAQKLNEAEEAHEEFAPGKNYFQESALGRYLSMLLYRNEDRWDDVRIDLEKISKGWKLQPDIYTFNEPDFSASTDQVYPPEARLNVIAFSGLGPEKKASSFYVFTEENLIVLAGTQEDYLGKQELNGLSAIPWPGVKAGYNFKFQLPKMLKHPSQVNRIDAEIESVGTSSLQRLESLENAAVETFGIRKPLIYMKTLTRAVVKGLATQTATEQATDNMDSGLAFFTRLATTALVNRTENADLRISRFFPADASIREIHLPEGLYNIRIKYYDLAGKLLFTDERNGVSIKAGKLNVLESAYLN
ncbi:hypothetical protein [Pontiella agarivorans]|uniref:Tetratricopeptide repeat-containing protein n=1 Tax=Pontiella agarivorans TaxID=3038953 RepID=A0ABU5MYS8_9BACT|nr:hypothetical protein [Pontiella agarivorans]MDZ8119344.1 hypothetical protein [Pontiella agarivorans]